MKKIDLKNKKNWYTIISITILLIIGVTTCCVLAVKNSGKGEYIETKAEIQEDKIEEDDSEISIEELEETIDQDEEKNNNGSNSKELINTSNAYYIRVNYGANVVTIYSKNESGEYTIPVKAMICSTGRATPTSGTYSIKSRWRWLALLGGVYGQYSTQIVGNILFHSVPYLERDNPASLEYWEYDKLRNKSISRMY